MTTTSTTVEVLGDRVLVLPDKKTKMLGKGLLHAPDSATDKPKTGVVIGVGPGVWSTDGSVRITPNLEPGDRVLYAQYGQVEYQHNDIDYLIFREQDIIARLIPTDEESTTDGA